MDQELLRVVHSGYVTQGPMVEEFEEALRGFFANDKVLTLNSATSAIHLALHLLRQPEGLWPGLRDHVDEVRALPPGQARSAVSTPGPCPRQVLSCPLTCTATNWPILANRLRIKWVDADPGTCNMCLTDLESKLTPNTKVIMVVHWGGSPIDLARLSAIQQRCFDRFGFRPAVIEDCAHAIGAEFGGKKLGSHGNLCCFSLQAIKHLTSIDGGVLIAPTARLFDRAKLGRWFGIDRERRSGGGDFRMEPPIEEYGFKFHMNDVNATIGLANTRHLPSILETCRANGAYLQKHLAGLRHITLLNPLPAGSVSSYWLFTLRVEKLLRASLMLHLKQHGIVASAVHQRNDVHPCVAQFATLLPQLNILADEILCLLDGWWVGQPERERIVHAVRAWTELPAQRALDTGLARSRASQRKRCVVTGGCGFIGHHVVEHFVKNTDYQVIVLDKLSYASKGYDRLRDSGVFHLIETHCVDLSSPIPPGLAYEMNAQRVEVVLHIAAETHVDNSIDTPVPFVENNIKSTLTVLEYSRTLPNLKHFIYFSTDEVYGSAEDGQAFKEGDAHKPSNPYSASKSAAEMICHSYYNTYHVPLITMNVMNAFGERQHPEKFIPLCIRKIFRGEKVTIHAYKGSLRAGSRFYIHARNIAEAVRFVLSHGKHGEKYNVKGEAELDNLQVARFIATELGKELVYEMHDNPHTRPGHDLRYSLDGTKLENLGWKLPLTFEESLRKTIQWTLDNPKWLDGDGLFAAPTSKL